MTNIVILAGLLITLVTGIPVLLQILRNHPKGLIILFFAEGWERFSYYGMRGLLVYYLTQHFFFEDSDATSTYGSYTSLVYLLPLIGGLLADRWLGTRKAVAFGALLLVAGHGLMAFEGRDSTQTLTYAGHSYEITKERGSDGVVVHIDVDGKPYVVGAGEGGGMAIRDLPANASLPALLPQGAYTTVTNTDPMGLNLFYLAVSLIIMGVGYLKPNISTIVGQLYAQGDPRRDSGFTLYYYGINLGSFWAAILCGWLGQTYGWAYGFGLAGLGMAAGLVVFVLGKNLLEGKAEPPNPALLKAPVFGPVNREHLIYLGGLAGVIPVFFLMQHSKIVGLALGVSIIASLAFIVFILATVCKTWAQRQRMMLAVVLVTGAVIFWTLFEQAGSSLALFADRNVNLTLFPQAMQFLGFTFGTPDQMAAAGAAMDGRWIDTTMTSSQTQSFNAGFILLFAPVFAALWAFLGKRDLDPNPTLKFGLALLQVGLGFLVVVWGAGMANSAFQVPIVLLGLLYMLHTTGELFLSPVGLSEITKLSMPAVVSFMMAVWFLASSIAQYVGGFIAGFAGTETVGGEVLDPALALETSLNVFEKLGYAGLIAGAVFIVLSFLIKGWSHGANDASNHPGPSVTDRGREDGDIARPAGTPAGG
jgi:POT family proton-dependent oligopeptide transporter